MSQGLWVGALKDGEEVIQPLADRIVGRVLQEDVIDANGEVVMELGKLVDEADAHRIAQAEDVEEVLIRSVLNCESDRGVCANCYGRNMATGQLVNIGEAVEWWLRRVLVSLARSLRCARSTSAAPQSNRRKLADPSSSRWHR